MIRPFSFLAILFLSTTAHAEGVVNLYSAQKEHLIRPILDHFTEKTGIKVNMTSGKGQQLIPRLEREGKLTEADVFLTVDIGNIYQAKEKGLLQPHKSSVLEKAIPSHLRDPEGYWFGYTVRARALFYNKEKVKPSELSTYAALADAKWKDRIIVRSSSNIYNQSLLASIMIHEGEENTLKWAKAIITNMARDPSGGDSDQLRGIANGEGDVTIANSYYYLRMLSGSRGEKDQALMQKIAMFFPNQETTGTHVNIRGGGITKHAKNKANAVKLLEFFASNVAQTFFASNNFEFPAKPGVSVPIVLSQFDNFKQDDMNLEHIGKLNREAVKLFDHAGWK
jgi:iron(III) transport system substrate-binding protein